MGKLPRIILFEGVLLIGLVGCTITAFVMAVLILAGKVGQ